MLADRMLQSIGFRGLMVGSGLLLIGILLPHILRLVLRQFGRGRPFDVEADSARLAWIFNGDEVEILSSLRARMPQALGLVTVGVFAVYFGLMGPRFKGIAPYALAIFAAFVAVFVLWAWAEKEYGRPGWFVPPELRGTPSRADVRRDEKRSNANSAESGSGEPDTGHLTEEDRSPE